MMKARSKSKIKHSVAFVKKPIEDRPKKCAKQLTKRKQQKQNINETHKFAMTTFNSKKKYKPSGEIQSSRQVSPLCLNRHKNGEKYEDERFIEKLFDKGYASNNYKNKSLFVQKLIEGLVSNDNTMPSSKGQSVSQGESTDVAKQLHLKNQQIASLQNQISELKLNLSTFSLKVFDLTVLCRKGNSKMWMDEQNGELGKKTDQVIAYLDSLVKRWKLQQKMKTHCEGLPMRASLATRNSSESKKRCHTQSLKIPIEQYLQSLQNTQHHVIGDQFSLRKEQPSDQQQQSEEIIKILSRRSSEIKKEEEEIYVAIRPFQSRNEHQLSLKVGQRVSVLQKTNNAKWLGLKDGKLGYFPQECLF